jgi:hypothetical protein
VLVLLHGSARFAEQKHKNTAAKRSHESDAQFRSGISCDGVAY